MLYDVPETCLHLPFRGYTDFDYYARHSTRYSKALTTFILPIFPLIHAQIHQVMRPGYQQLAEKILENIYEYQELGFTVAVVKIFASGHNLIFFLLFLVRDRKYGFVEEVVE